MLNRVITRTFFFKRNSLSRRDKVPATSLPPLEKDEHGVDQPRQSQECERWDEKQHIPEEAEVIEGTSAGVADDLVPSSDVDAELQPSKEPGQDGSSSFIVVSTQDCSSNHGDEVEEAFKTPILTDGDGEFEPAETTMLQAGPSDLLDAASTSLEVAQVQESSFSSLIVAPPSPLSSPPLSQRPFAVDMQSGMLSDITEADEPSICGVSTASASLHWRGKERELSFASFGSSYPNTPQVESVPVFEELKADLTAPPDEAEPSADEVPPLCPPTNGLFSDVPPAEPRGIGCDTESQMIPLCMEPAQTTSPAREMSTQPEVTQMCEEAFVVAVPTPSTYADATNLALQHPELSARILQQPLSSTRNSPQTSACPSMYPTPSVSFTGSPVPSTSDPASGLGNNSCLTSSSAIVVPPARTMPSHSAEHPNWALAPDEPAKSRSETKLPKQRGRGKSRSKATSASTGRCAEDLASPCKDTSTGARQGNPQVQARAQTLAQSTTSPISSDRERDAGNATRASLTQASKTASPVDPGFQPWLERVDVWMGNPTATDALASVPANPAPQDLAQNVSNETRRRREPSGLNPYAPAWEPGKQSTARDFDVVIENIRGMLRDSGIGDSSMNSAPARPSTPMEDRKADGAVSEVSGSEIIPSDDTPQPIPTYTSTPPSQNFSRAYPGGPWIGGSASDDVPSYPHSPLGGGPIPQAHPSPSPPPTAPAPAERRFRPQTHMPSAQQPQSDGSTHPEGPSRAPHPANVCHIHFAFSDKPSGRGYHGPSPWPASG